MLKRALLNLLAAATLFAQQHARPIEQARVDPLAGLTAEQREYCESILRRTILTGGRRSGKTEAVVAKLVKVAMGGGSALYISLTRVLAKKTVWKRIQKRLRQLNVAFTKNETSLTIEVAGGGTIEIGGADDKEAIERYRGLAWTLVVIDECGAFPSELLKKLVNDVLRPGLMDHQGMLTLAGTPSPVLAGYWFEQAGPDGLRSSKNKRWEWTIHHNPLFEGRVDDELAQVLEENDGWTRDTVTFRREYLGEWVQDESVLCYPYSAARNGIDQLPTRSPRGVRLNGRRWRHVISIDCGTTEEAMAITVLASHEKLPDDYIIHAEAHTGMGVDALIARVRALLRRYPHAVVVIDAGGMGAAHALELGNAGIPFVAASKTAKASAIRIMHDRVLAGRVKLLSIPALDGVRKEWAALGWDEDHLLHHPEQPDHYSDSCLYGLRELHHWRTKADVERAEHDPGDVDEERAEHTWH